jgi:hypothetical protein
MLKIPRHEEVTTITEVVGDFGDVFEEIKGLPPSRSHAILLKQDAELVSVRHYLYS